MYRFLNAAVKFPNKKALGAQVLALRGCTTSTGANPPVGDVPGLSTKIVDVPCENVGFPGASKNATYKNPEYFCYHKASYFEAEVEMLKYRLPQPSSRSQK